jgi:hypothetical protein
LGLAAGGLLLLRLGWAERIKGKGVKEIRFWGFGKRVFKI